MPYARARDRRPEDPLLAGGWTRRKPRRARLEAAANEGVKGTRQGPGKGARS